MCVCERVGQGPGPAWGGTCTGQALASSPLPHTRRSHGAALQQAWGPRQPRQSPHLRVLVGLSHAFHLGHEGVALALQAWVGGCRREGPRAAAQRVVSLVRPPQLGAPPASARCATSLIEGRGRVPLTFKSSTCCCTSASCRAAAAASARSRAASSAAASSRRCAAATRASAASAPPPPAPSLVCSWETCAAERVQGSGTPFVLQLAALLAVPLSAAASTSLDTRRRPHAACAAQQQPPPCHTHTSTHPPGPAAAPAPRARPPALAPRCQRAAARFSWSPPQTGAGRPHAPWGGGWGGRGGGRRTSVCGCACCRC